MTLNKMFNIVAIAVIGTSNNPCKASHQIINTMIKKKYKSTIFPVNPTQQQVHGLPCRPSLLHMENRVDLLIISVPAESVFEALKFVELIVDVSRLVTEHPEIKQLDLNRIRFYPKSLLVLDIKMLSTLNAECKGYSERHLRKHSIG
jgi:hypothetical protein